MSTLGIAQTRVVFSIDIRSRESYQYTVEICMLRCVLDCRLSVSLADDIVVEIPVSCLCAPSIQNTCICWIVMLMFPASDSIEVLVSNPDRAMAAAPPQVPTISR